jgi:hypothetical protein
VGAKEPEADQSWDILPKSDQSWISQKSSGSILVLVLKTSSNCFKIVGTSEERHNHESVKNIFLFILTAFCLFLHLFLLPFVINDTVNFNNLPQIQILSFYIYLLGEQLFSLHVQVWKTAPYPCIFKLIAQVTITAQWHCRGSMSFLTENNQRRQIFQTGISQISHLMVQTQWLSKNLQLRFQICKYLLKSIM